MTGRRHPDRPSRRSLLPVVAVLAALLTAAVFVPTASACSCAELPLEQHVEMVDAVFVGKVTQQEVVGKNPMGDNEIRVTVTVEKVAKGKVPPTVTFRTSDGCCYCAYTFEDAETYLLFAYEDEDGTYTTDICTPTAPVAQAREVMRALEGLKGLEGRGWQPPEGEAADGSDDPDGEAEPTRERG